MSYLKPAGEAVAVALRAIGGLFDSMAQLCETGAASRADTIPLDPGTVPFLTFRSVVEWLTCNRPKDARVAKAALIRQTVGTATKVVTVYLDSSNSPVVGANGLPFGRAQLATRLDQELTEFFGTRSMVLFE